MTFAYMTSESWYLDQSNEFADNVHYGQVTIDADSSAGTVTFTVDAFNAYAGIDDNFGIQEFGFNYQNLTDDPSEWSLSLPEKWQQREDDTLSGFGLFEIHEKGLGNSRQAPLVFTITLPTASDAIVSNFTVATEGNPGEGNFFFVAHVAGFTASDTTTTSHWIGGGTGVPIPEPCTTLFILSGLMLGAWRKNT